MGSAVINLTFSGVSALRTKKLGHSHLSSLTGPCLCARPPLFSLCPIVRGGLAVSHRAHVQRGESETAHCASTGNRQASFFFYSSSPLLEGLGKTALYCARHSHPPNPERAETRSCPTRALSECARSASKKGTWPLLSHLKARSFSLQGWGLIDLPLRAWNKSLPNSHYSF